MNVKTRLPSSFKELVPGNIGKAQGLKFEAKLILHVCSIVMALQIHLKNVRVLPSGNPELIRISLSCTLASQVILSVDILSLLCSQKRISASSPPILK